MRTRHNASQSLQQLERFIQWLILSPMLRISNKYTSTRRFYTFMWILGCIAYTTPTLRRRIETEAIGEAQHMISREENWIT